MSRTFPWEGITSPMYAAHEVKPRKKWVIYYGWGLAALLLVGGFMTRFKIALFFAVIIALALISKKTVMVTERGVESFMDMRFTSYYEIWKWEEIEALTHEVLKEFPGSWQLYFTRGDRTRKIFFKEADAKEILKLAKKQNSKIRLYDGNVYMEEYRKQQQKKGKKK
ncbi:MAG: hypothetical protein IJJ25_06145 [Lachnospiraceae bacterium]|nr:hypothetical protein [Lachnospiraceae bacterium]